MMISELQAMRRAIDLAHAHLGRTAENPSVGCVLVKDGVIVGEGVTGLGGRPHAEEVALDQAGAAAKGSSAYVTLEPCAHRTTGAVACTERLIESGVVKVAIACADASIHAAGQGAAKLIAAEIPIQFGLLADEAAFLYTDYRPA